MTLKEKIANKIKDKKGIALIGVLIAAIAFGILAIPMSKWVMSMNQNISMNEKNLENFSERLEMQSIIQDYLRQMNTVTHEEFEADVASKGTKWTESIGGKYDVTITFSGKGKYANSVCEVGTLAGNSDKQCRNVGITIVSKSDSSLQEVLQAVRVSAAGESTTLKEIDDAITANNKKFNTIYKKNESDARYVRYGMGDFACPWDYKKSTTSVGCDPCDAPANEMQYRSGNCQLAMCPPGQVANETQTGCVARVCENGFKLNAAGTACETCSGITDAEYAAPVRKKYYGANCSIQTCPIGQTVNSQDTGCEDIVCPAGFELIGDDCKCPSNQIYDEASDSCKTCSSGYKPNADQTACEQACISHEEIYRYTQPNKWPAFKAENVRPRSDWTSPLGRVFTTWTDTGFGDLKFRYIYCGNGHCSYQPISFDKDVVVTYTSDICSWGGDCSSTTKNSDGTINKQFSANTSIPMFFCIYETHYTYGQNSGGSAWSELKGCAGDDNKPVVKICVQ